MTMRPRLVPLRARSVFLIALALAFDPGVGRATVLTFDIDGIAAGSNMPGTYGDRIVSTNDAVNGFSYGNTGGFTPNVTVAYTGLDIFNDTSLKWRNSGYSDFGECVSYVTGTTFNWGVQFHADEGFKVTLAGFDLGKSGSSAVMGGALVQNAAGATVWDSGDVTLNGAGAPGQTFVLPAGITDTRLTLIVRARVVSPDPAPPGTNGTALDNIVFSQASLSGEPDLVLSTRPNGDIEIAFTGTLETSSDLGVWTAVTPAPASPYVIPRTGLAGRHYFRAAQ
jgi:hypothetical protein